MTELTAPWGQNDEGDKPRWSKTDALRKYRTRVDRAKNWRTQEGHDDTWRRMRDLYRGKHFNQFTEEDMIAVNIAFATINVILPSVAVNHPKITIVSRKEDESDKATIAEAVINYWWRHFDLKTEFQLAVKDFLIYGHGWIKVSYRYTEEEQEISPEEHAQSLEQARQLSGQLLGQGTQSQPPPPPPLGGPLGMGEGLPPELQAMMGDAPGDEDPLAPPPGLQDPNAPFGAPTDDELAETLPTTKMVAVEDRVATERVSPFDMFVDPEAVTLDDAAWIAQRVVRTVEEVRKDERYKKSVRKQVEADSEVRTHDEYNSDQESYNDDIKRVTLWEFYDMHRQTVSVFTRTGDKFLIDPKPFPYTFGLPYIMIRNYDIPDEFYPMGDLEEIGPLQDELNETRSSMMQHRKVYARKYLYKRSAFGQTGIGALSSNEDNVLVPIEDENISLNDAIVPMPVTTPDPQMYQYSDVIENDIDRISGINEYMRGALPEIRRTATEASIIQDAANSRSAHKLDIIESAIRDIARKLIGLAQQYVTDEQVARVMGLNGQAVWAPFTREDIQGEFDFEVEAGSTQPMNETFQRQQAMQMMQSLMPFVGMGLMNAVELIRYVLQKGFGIKNPERFIDPNAMMIQQMQQQQLLQQMQGGGSPDGGGGPPGPSIGQGDNGQGGGVGPPVTGPPQTGVGAGTITQLQNQVGLDLPNLRG